MTKKREFLSVFILGALMYGLLEIIWRGYTHWSMLITGGVCFLVLYVIAPLSVSPLMKALYGSAFITLTELVVGILVNIVWGLDVWDYSDMPYNLFGQISFLYSAYWFILSFAAIPICRALRKRLTQKRAYSNSAISHIQ